MTDKVYHKQGIAFWGYKSDGKDKHFWERNYLSPSLHDRTVYGGNPMQETIMTEISYKDWRNAKSLNIEE